MKKLLWLLCLCLLTGCGLCQLHTEAPAETALPTAAVTEAGYTPLGCANA